MIGVDENLESVGAGPLVTASEPRDDRIGMRVVELRADIERSVIIGDVDDGTLTRHGTLIGVTLRKTCDPLSGPPQRLVEHAINGDRLPAR